MTRLLVSVRSAAEALLALAGGAKLIDVKEPAHGPLGRAAPHVIDEVLASVRGRVPVSAALGEAAVCGEFLPHAIARRLAFVKYGPAGCDLDRWSETFSLAQRRLAEMRSSCRVVVVAYADWQRANGPVPEQLCRFACGHRAGAFLLDTCGKDGSTLLDCLPLTALTALCDECRAAGVPVALAGALGPRQIREVALLRPDWIAVRGAACRDAQRGSELDLDRVRALADLVETLNGRAARVSDRSSSFRNSTPVADAGGSP